MVKGEERWVESVGVVVQGAEELVYIHREPPLLAREYRSIVPRSLSLSLSLFLPLPILQSVPTLSTTSLSLSLSLSLSPIHTLVRPSPSMVLCLALFRGATRLASRAPVSPKIPAENRIGKNQEKVAVHAT